LIRSPIKGEHIAVGVGEGPHAAASTGSCGLGNGRRFALESFAFVGRAGNKYGAPTFAIGIAGLRGMPGDIDVSLRVGGDRASAIESVGVSNYVPFGFKGSAFVIEACVKKRLFVCGVIVTGTGIG
jgi:hypothetical protein